MVSSEVNNFQVNNKKISSTFLSEKDFKWFGCIWIYTTKTKWNRKKTFKTKFKVHRHRVKLPRVKRPRVKRRVAKTFLKKSVHFQKKIRTIRTIFEKKSVQSVQFSRKNRTIRRFVMKKSVHFFGKIRTFS